MARWEAPLHCVWHAVLMINIALLSHRGHQVCRDALQLHHVLTTLIVFVYAWTSWLATIWFSPWSKRVVILQQKRFPRPKLMRYWHLKPQTLQISTLVCQKRFRFPNIMGRRTRITNKTTWRENWVHCRIYTPWMVLPHRECYLKWIRGTDRRIYALSPSGQLIDVSFVVATCY